MSDWDTVSPGDTSIVAQFPANERAARASLVTNFGVDHHSTNDANVGKHTVVKLLEQGSDPSATAGEGKLYTKDTGGQSELFWISDTGAAVQLTSAGKIPDARLSANVPLLDAANVFTGSTFTIGATAGSRALNIKAAGAWIRLEETDAGVNEKIWLIGQSGGASAGLQIFARDDADATGNSAIQILRSGTTITEIQLDTTLVDLNGSLDVSGTVTSPGTSAAEIGYNGAPQNAQNGDYTLVLADRGKTIYKASGGAGETVTIPANASVAFPVGTIIRIVNNGGGDLTIAITSDTLSLAGAGTTGSRTLADHGVAVIEKIATTEWFISGAGLA